MLTIDAIPAFADNYIWMLARGGVAWVVDPGDAAPVQRTLAERGLTLGGILVTHHHGDHIGGIARLLADRSVPVLGPRAEAATIPHLTRLLDDGDRVTLPGMDLEFDVIAVPGHTLGHIAFVRTAGAPGPFVLCGDTLFSAGCGRLFEGTPRQMHASLERLRTLDPATDVYCTHEYTVSNLAFAQAVEPSNRHVHEATEQAQRLRAGGRPTLPSSIGRERQINPFLRCSEPAVRAAAEARSGASLPGEADVFAVLRKWKDGFRPAAPVV